MNNSGGTIKVANQWQQVLAADSSRTEATVQNTCIDLPGFDRDGVHDGPHLEIWPFATAPTAADSLATGAGLCRRAGDSIRFSGAGSQGTIYVRGPRAGATFAVLVP